MKRLDSVWIAVKHSFSEASKNIGTTIAATLLICVLVIIFLYIGLFLGSLGNTSASDYLKLILAWPTLSFLGLIIFISKFQDPISQFLSEHTINKFGAVEWEKKQKQTEEEPTASPKTPNAPTSPATSEASESEKLKAELEEIKQFHNLDQFLVAQTKKVLLWFYSTTSDNTATSKIAFETAYQSFIPDPSQRAIIFDVLQKNELIASKDGENYVATGKALRFLEYLGLLKK